MDIYKIFAITTFLTIPTALFAHDDHEVDRCAVVAQSVTDAGFSDVVTVECVDGQALLHSSTYPDHELMTGIVGSNEQIPVPAVDYTAPIPLEPVLGTDPQTRDAALGVAVNGVPIYDSTGGGEMSQADLQHYQEQHDTLQTQQLDICGGHAGKGNDYHYHVKPVCMMEHMLNADNNPIIGWAYDGFPIYGDDNPDGTAIAEGALDICNGQADTEFGYRYQTSTKPPYIIQCLMGEVASMKDLPRVAPMQAAGGGRGPSDGRPPQGGVENLVFTQDDAGTRLMTYVYEGKDYYMKYTPSATENCYNFETKTVTDNGEIYTGELCR